jgi:hypothetical protein
MDLLGGVGQMKACFGPFGDSVNKHAIKGAWFAPNVK